MLVKMNCANGGGVNFANGVETFSSAAEEKSINCGFKPKYIVVMRIESGTVPNVGNGSCVNVYNSDFSETMYYTGSRTNGGAMYLTQYTIGDHGGLDITEINLTGFKYKVPANYNGTYYWFAVG